MITTKHGIKFSLKLNDKKLKITPAIKKYFEEVEKKIAKELDILEFNDSGIWIISNDGKAGFSIKPVHSATSVHHVAVHHQ